MDWDDQAQEQARILSEVAHDLANRFHRFYYYQDLAGGVMAESPSEAHAMLAKALETVEGIEALTRAALAFVRPLELRAIRVRAADVVGSLRQHLGDHPLELCDGDGRGSAVIAIDPTRLGEVLATACKTLTARAAEGAPLRVELAGAGALELRLSIAAAVDTALIQDLALAIAARIVALHGGELSIPAGPRGGTVALTVRLPLATQE